MSIATYIVPTPGIVELIQTGNRARAMFLWVKLPHRLLDGTRVRPSLKTAQAMVQSVQLGIHSIPMCIHEGDYRIDSP